MARISKHVLSEKQQNELVSQLDEAIGKMNVSLAHHFLNEFFGQEEKIMIAKRLAIIALIHENRPLHRIATHLHVSETTVSNLKIRYELGTFTQTIKVLTKNKVTYKQFLKLLDLILTAGGIMPYRNTPIRIPR